MPTMRLLPVFPAWTFRVPAQCNSLLLRDADAAIMPPTAPPRPHRAPPGDLRAASLTPTTRYLRLSPDHGAHRPPDHVIRRHARQPQRRRRSGQRTRCVALHYAAPPPSTVDPAAATAAATVVGRGSNCLLSVRSGMAGGRAARGGARFRSGRRRRTSDLRRRSTATRAWSSGPSACCRSERRVASYRATQDPAHRAFQARSLRWHRPRRRHPSSAKSSSLPGRLPRSPGRSSSRQRHGTDDRQAELEFVGRGCGGGVRLQGQIGPVFLTGAVDCACSWENPRVTRHGEDVALCILCVDPGGVPLRHRAAEANAAGSIRRIKCVLWG